MRRVLPTLLLLLAGCSAPAPPDDPTAGAEAPDPLAWTGGGCDGRGDFVAADLGWTDSQVPDAYPPAEFVPQRGSLVFLTVSCAKVHAGNGTAAADEATLAVVQLQGSSSGDPAFRRFYLLRAYHPTGDGPLATLLRQQGIDVAVAERTMDSWNGPMTLAAADHEVEVTPIVPNTGAMLQFRETWLLLMERPQGRLEWSWDLGTYGTTESHLVHSARLAGGPYVGACGVGAASVCDANTDDYRTFGLAGRTATEGEANA